MRRAFPSQFHWPHFPGFAASADGDTSYGKLSGDWVTTRPVFTFTTDRMLDEIEDEVFNI